MKDTKKLDKKKILIITSAIAAILLVMTLSLVFILRDKKDGDTAQTAERTWADKLTTEAAGKKSEASTAVASGKKNEKTAKNKTASGKSSVKTNAGKGDKDTKSSSKDKTTTEAGSQKAGVRATTEAGTQSETKRPATEAPTERATERTTTEAPTERATERATTEAPTERATERTTECQHDWVAQTKTEKVLVEESWDEEIYETRLKCAYCGKDVTDDGDGVHVSECGEMVYDPRADQWFPEGAAAVTYQKLVKTIHHPDEYEDRTVTTGYRCSKCGAVK